MADFTSIDPLWDFHFTGDDVASPLYPEPKWCITCGPSAPLAQSDPDYCEMCETHAAWRREDANAQKEDTR